MTIESPAKHFQAHGDSERFHIYDHDGRRVAVYYIIQDSVNFMDNCCSISLPALDDLYRLLKSINRRTPVPTEPLFISLRIEIAEGDTDNSTVCFTRYLAKVIGPLGVYYTFNITTGYGSTKSLVYTIILSAMGVHYVPSELSNKWMTMAVEHIIQPIGVTERLLDYETMWLR